MLQKLPVFIMMILLLDLTTTVQGQVRGDDIDLTGTSDDVQFSSDAGFEQQSSFTVSFWFDDNGSNSNNDVGLFSRWGNSEQSYMIFENSSDNLQFKVTDGTNTVTITNSTTDIQNDVPHFIVAVLDASNDKLKLYVDDDVSTKDISGSNFDASNINYSASQQLNLGTYDKNNSNTNKNILGKFDELKFWSDARTQSEIEEYKHRSTPVSSVSNLEHYYNMNNNNGNSSNTEDQAGSNNGTVNSGSFVSSSAVITDATELDGGKYSTEVEAVWEADNDAVSKGLRVFESKSKFNKDGFLIVGHDGGTGIVSDYEDNNNNTDNRLGRVWYYDNQLGNAKPDFTFNTDEAQAGSSSGSVSDFDIVEGESSSNFQEDVDGATSATFADDNIRFDGINFGSGNNKLNYNEITLGNDEPNNSTLPVELTSFTATAKDGFNKLKWETASETNNRHFQVQKRVAEQWQNIGRVDGHGTTTEPQTYTFKDAAIRNVRTSYYRLKQVDFDGSYEYTNITVVNREASEFDSGNPSLTLFPNPVTDNLRYQLAGQVEGTAEVTIRNMYGKEVYRTSQAVEPGSIQNLPVQHLTDGQYVLIFQDEDIRLHKRFVKVD